MSHTKPGRLHNSSLYIPAKDPVSSTSDYAMQDMGSFLFAALILNSSRVNKNKEKRPSVICSFLFHELRMEKKNACGLPVRY